MKKVFALFITTALCTATFLPVLVSGKKSPQKDEQSQGVPESVQYGPEVQIGEHAVSGHVRNMAKGKDKGKHLAHDKDYPALFNPDGRTRLGFTIDPVVQTFVPDTSLTPLMMPAPASAPSTDAPSPNATTQLLGNPGFENGSANPAPWVPTAGVIDSSASEAPHSGAWKAWMDGYGSTHTDTLYQQVTIPAGATATLTFWLHIDSA